MGMMPITLSALVKTRDDSANAPVVILDLGAERHSSQGRAERTGCRVPPPEGIVAGEAKMEAMTRRFAADVLGIAEAVRRGEQQRARAESHH